MSELSANKEYDTLASAFEFSFRQKMKNVYTCMPGTVEGNYDPDTRTVDVRGSLNVVKSDGTSFTRSVIRGVPIVYPAAGLYRIQFPLSAGDSVLLLFSQRGLNKWKGGLRRAVDPEPWHLFAEQDAICVPGFGRFGNRPPPGDGLTIFIEQGPSIELNSGGIVIRGDVTVHGTVTEVTN